MTKQEAIDWGAEQLAALPDEKKRKAVSTLRNLRYWTKILKSQGALKEALIRGGFIDAESEAE